MENIYINLQKKKVVKDPGKYGWDKQDKQKKRQKYEKN